MWQRASTTAAIAVCFATSVTAMTWYLITRRQNEDSSEKKTLRTAPSMIIMDDKQPPSTESKRQSSKDVKQTIPIRLVYGSQTGTSKRLAESLQRTLFALNISGYHFETSVVNMKEYDQDNLEHEAIVIAILSTWTGGVPPADARIFCNWVADMATDFRVSKQWLEKTQYAVFGLGNSDYEEDYGQAALVLDGHLATLGAKRLCSVSRGDDSQDLEKQFGKWSTNIVVALCELYSNSKTKKEWLSQKEFRRQKKMEEKASEVPVEWTEEDYLNDEMLMEEEDEEEEEPKKDDSSLVDVEEIGATMKEAAESAASKEMVTPMQRKALTKEGYKIIGTHSAVKLCRWTKHQLRGRGGCYKHTFYGITSYQCMETTPSLACANKCVFCWRHHKNPVGREWRWKVDDPKELVDGSIDRHQKMIKELKGLPGLKLDRWREAFTVRHCALSLVGEPIMYPHINTFCKLLHEKEISTFLVTNAQFPDKISELEPITQLYVSVDAGTKESLRAVDRPLFKDFWERFLECLKKLKEKGQRTVYRMTLVKDYNMSELDDYAELISVGSPDLIEVKGVTYCGKSDGSDLTMKNIPWHEEVRDFAGALCDRLEGSYGLAAEHAHSNCVLIAKKEFYINDTWHTWIDYEKFHCLMKRFYNDGTTFTTSDYLAPTPSWAVFGAEEEGFDPVETRFRRTKNGTLKEYEYKSTESGCG